MSGLFLRFGADTVLLPSSPLRSSLRRDDAVRGREHGFWIQIWIQFHSCHLLVTCEILTHLTSMALDAPGPQLLHLQNEDVEMDYL